MRPSLDATTFLSRLYLQKGIRGLFDGVGLHPYAADPRLMAADISAVRAVMRSHGEGHKGLYITEFGWGSQTRAAGGDKFERGPAVQAEYVRARLGNPARKPPPLEPEGRLLVHLAGHSGRQHPVRLLRFGGPARPRRQAEDGSPQFRPSSPSLGRGLELRRLDRGREAIETLAVERLFDDREELALLEADVVVKERPQLLHLLQR